MGEYLSIDEVAVWQGELYTVLTNKAKKGKSEALVSRMKGTQAETIIAVLKKIFIVKRLVVKEITADLSAFMQRMAKQSFPNALLFADRFYVQQLIGEAFRDLRIEYCWEALENENQAIKTAKENGKVYSAKLFRNGDTPKQLLARSRYLLFKHHSKWTPSQIIRAEILFKPYPDMEKAYKVAMQFTSIYNRKIDRACALTPLALWYKHVEELNSKYFNTLL